jgi:ribosome-binding protein aMBF1 (putative translation factor)
MGDRTDSDTALVSVLRGHVLDPLADAQAIVQREATEIDTELEAFDQLAQQVTTIETVPDRRPEPQAHTLTVESQLQAAEQLREAYRETVMDVPHYDDVYGESLERNVAAELPPDVAVLFQDPADRITPDQKTRIRAAATNARASRETLAANLADEQESLVTAYDKLDAVITQLDGPHVPGWYAAQFKATLTKTIQTRQEILAARPHRSRADGHDLCHYLYTNQGWTYPVLTAVARLRSAVECPE